MIGRVIGTVISTGYLATGSRSLPEWSMKWSWGDDHHVTVGDVL
ncbi:MAG: hypothetical protein AVDCRST_MAG70-2494 [uncultured Thermomicrobiales bacterium]|uniref:Uncharacterized protein n=1 Tax=uncultured Thermomicrobiales bacterium TaxID=1645740 RepID=A0A6J4V9C7_9BACT|nr:MAG: hypothetical protein AVDCRST_MAG70-2494 [uncultured Thermomicrobiales bacterium]